MDRRTRWQQGQDMGVAALVAALGLVEVWLPMDSVMGSGSRLLSTVGILLVAALMTQRRVRPGSSIVAMAVWPALGVLASGEVQILFFGQLVPLMLLVYSVSRHGCGRQTWLGPLAAAALLLLGDLFVDLLNDPGELAFHWGVVTLAFLVGRGLRGSEERAAASAVRAVEAEQATRERTLAAVADERARIARELHDIVAHSVSMIVVQAGAAEQVVQEDPEFARRALGTIRSTGTSALGEMRRVVAMLREPDAVDDLTPQPGIAALPALVGAARETGLEVDLDVGERTGTLPAGLDLTAYRIVQEALTNVRRHSGATRAGVLVRFTASALEIEVTDNGPGRNGSKTAGHPGHGLIGMRERAALYGGQLEAAGNGRGFTVRAVLPVEGA